MLQPGTISSLNNASIYVSLSLRACPYLEEIPSVEGKLWNWIPSWNIPQGTCLLFSYPVAHGYRETFFQNSIQTLLTGFSSDALKSSLVTVDFRGSRKIILDLSMSKGHMDSYSLALVQSCCVQRTKIFQGKYLGISIKAVCSSQPGGSWGVIQEDLIIKGF